MIKFDKNEFDKNEFYKNEIDKMCTNCINYYVLCHMPHITCRVI